MKPAIRVGAVGTDRVIAAREKSALLWLEFYCESPRCAAREISVHVKDHDDVLVEWYRKSGVVCPLCGARLRLQSAMTLADHVDAEDAAARARVNVQMYERDHGGPDELCAIPVALMGDHRLPPTPDGWFDRFDRVEVKP